MKISSVCRVGKKNWFKKDKDSRKNKVLEGFKKRRESGLIWRSVNSHGNGGKREQRRPVADGDERLQPSLAVAALYTRPQSAFEAVFFGGGREKKGGYVDANRRGSEVKMEIARSNCASSSPCVII